MEIVVICLTAFLEINKTGSSLTNSYLILWLWEIWSILIVLLKY